jgi:hypothetical protein
VAQTLSPAQVNFLRKVVKDPAERKRFLTEPAPVLKAAGLTSHEALAMSKITAQEIDGLQRAVKRVSLAADDSCTLVYAVAFAVALALLL